jgi:hypothetical protein
MKCHNIFTLDENRDEPTFTIDILKKERGRKKFFIYKAFLNDGTKKVLLTDGKEWLDDKDSYEEIALTGQLYLYGGLK